MYDTIAALHPRDNDFPERAWRLAVLRSLLMGTFYDRMEHAFHVEYTAGGEYVSIANRRPCIRYGLPYLIVRDTIGFLFSEGHFPEIECDDEAAQEWLRLLVRDSRLNEFMLDAALRGSVGSVCLWVRLLSGRLFFKALETEFLTPAWDPATPDTLVSVTELKKVDGAELIALGYSGIERRKRYWWQRVWDATAETWFVPWECAVVEPDQKEHVPAVDKARTTVHGLGFVPLVWIRNMPGGDDTDGACTFWHARHTAVEIDYLLSHGRRGLRWSCDPLLAVKDPTQDLSGKPMGGGNVLALSDTGDAKYLEISGASAMAVVDYAKALRELTLETIGGNRAPADKIAAAQSGRAIELMNHGLIVLADQLRTTYGEGGFRAVLQMALEMRRRQPIEVNGARVPEPADGARVTLRWPAWYAPTPDDELARSTALVAYVGAGVLSREDATNVVAPQYDIEDTDGAVTRAGAEREADAKMTADLAAKSKPQPEKGA